MLDVLEAYLKQNAMPELLVALREAHQAFERIDFPNYQEVFLDLIMVDDENDHGDTLLEIVKLTKTIQRQILREHDIVLRNEASIDMLTTFINGVLDLQDYEDKDAIWQTANLDGDPEEVFAELLTLVTPLTADDLLVEIETVSDMLVMRIKELAQSQPTAPSEETQAMLEQHIGALKKLCDFIGDHELDTVKMLAQGTQVGYPFAVYLGTFGHDLETLSVEQATHELLAMAYISSDGVNNPQSVITEQLEQYISNIDMITKINVKVSEILLGLQR